MLLSRPTDEETETQFSQPVRSSPGFVPRPVQLQSRSSCVVAPSRVGPALDTSLQIPGPSHHSFSQNESGQGLLGLSHSQRPPPPTEASPKLLLGSRGLAARAGAGPLTQLEPLSSSWIKTWKRLPCSCRIPQKRPPTLNRTTTKSSMTSLTWGTLPRAQVRGGGAPGMWGPGNRHRLSTFHFYR